MYLYICILIICIFIIAHRLPKLSDKVAYKSCITTAKMSFVSSIVLLLLGYHLSLLNTFFFHISNLRMVLQYLFATWLCLKIRLKERKMGRILYW